MTFSQRFIPFAMVAISLVSLGVSAGEQKGSNAGEPTAPTASSTAVETLQTAADLVRYGDANKDALALITAARIMKQVGFGPSKAVVVTSSKADGTKPDKASVDAVLARARQYAGDRKDLLALADDVVKMSPRGSVNGHGRITTIVGRGMTDVYQITYKGGERAGVLAVGDGDSDLDMYVYDENGNLICKDDDLTDRMVCRWSPAWQGQFTIKIKNLGMANQYTLINN